MEFVLNMLMFLVAVFLILLVLVQRGRGGGLAGALGGMGGQSAFGTKAGDLFTRVTIVVAAVWILLCVVVVKYHSNRDLRPAGLGAEPAVSIDAPLGTGTGALGTPTTGGAAGGALTTPADEKPAAGGAAAPATSSSESKPAEKPATPEK